MVRGQGNTVKLRKGQVLVNAFKKDIKFKLNTPVATVAVRGTKYYAEVNEISGGGANQPQEEQPKNENNKEPDNQTAANNYSVNIGVFEGVVEASNEYGAVNINAGEVANVTGANAPSEPTKMSEDKKTEVENFDKTTKAKGSFKLEPETTVADVGSAVGIAITVLDENNKPDAKFTDNIDLNTDSASSAFSIDNGKTWGVKKVSIKDGKGKVWLRDTEPGKVSMSVTYQDYASDGVIITYRTKITGQQPRNKTLILNVETEDGKTQEIKLRFEK